MEDGQAEFMLESDHMQGSFTNNKMRNRDRFKCTLVLAAGFGRTTRRGGGIGGASRSGDGLLRGGTASSADGGDARRISEAERCLRPDEKNPWSDDGGSGETLSGLEAGLDGCATENLDIDLTRPRGRESPPDTTACSLEIRSPTE